MILQGILTSCFLRFVKLTLKNPRESFWIAMSLSLSKTSKGIESGYMLRCRRSGYLRRCLIAGLCANLLIGFCPKANCLGEVKLSINKLLFAL